MATVRPTPRPSKVHPIHGILSAFPVAFFTGALVTDLIYVGSAQIQWANFSVWQITFGLVMGVAAAIAGIVDAVRNRDRPRRRPWLHTVLAGLMMVVALFNVFIHSRDVWTSVVPAGLVLSAITALLALVSAWLGHSLEDRQERF